MLEQIIRGSAGHLTDTGRLAIVTDLVNVPTYGNKLKAWWQGTNARMLVLQTADRDEKLFTVPHVHRPFDQSLADFETEFDHWVQNFRDARLKAVNFGYIFIWCEADSEIVIRTINNPTAPIHGSVARWFASQGRVGDPKSCQSYLVLHPELRFVERRQINGELDYVELTVPENPFYTTYRVPPTISDALKRIHQTKPRLAERYNESDAEWLLDLLRKNILLTVTELTRLREDSRTVTAADISERPTKTTPTCLSSYLR